MYNLEDKVDALMQLCAAQPGTEQEKARRLVRGIAARYLPETMNTEALVRRLLLELGAPDHLLGHAYTVLAVRLVPDHLLGHAYTVLAVRLVVQDEMYIHSITFGLYPQVAAAYHTTAARVERGIRSLVEVTWERGSLDAQERYFGSIVSSERGKPSNAEFIARLANIVQMQQKGVWK